MKTVIRKILIITCTMLMAGAANAQRGITINGMLLSDAQLQQVDRAACTTVPDGHYWLNMRTGAWGYAGNPTRMGFIGEACQRRQSLSERRQLYRPGEILSDSGIRR